MLDYDPNRLPVEVTDDEAGQLLVLLARYVDAYDEDAEALTVRALADDLILSLPDALIPECAADVLGRGRTQ